MFTINKNGFYMEPEKIYPAFLFINFIIKRILFNGRKRAAK
jgi:hypothetical protein